MTHPPVVGIIHARHHTLLVVLDLLFLHRPIAKRLAQFLANPAQLDSLPPHMLQAEGSLSVRGKVVLELGSGPGFLSIFAHRLGARHVTMTDQAPLLPLMLMNREDNGVSERDVHVVDLDWCCEEREVFPPLHVRRTSSVDSSPSESAKNIDTFGDAQKKTPDPDGEFDVILCSDLIYSGYQRDPCTPLAETLNRCVIRARSLLVALYTHTHTHTLVCHTKATATTMN